MDIFLAAIVLVVGWIANAGLEYAKSKGKNLADKEDIAAITRLVEDVKAENAVLLERMRAQGQLRLAAAERRLTAHQEAFTLWRKLIKHSRQDTAGSVVMECQDWWERNCIFLTAEAREAFNRAYVSAASHRFYLEGPRDEESAKLIQQNWADVKDAGDAILRGVDLPSLGAAETDSLKT